MSFLRSVIVVVLLFLWLTLCDFFLGGSHFLHSMWPYDLAFSINCTIGAEILFILKPRMKLTLKNVVCALGMIVFWLPCGVAILLTQEIDECSTYLPKEE